MRHTFLTRIATILFTVITALFANRPLFADSAAAPAASKPAPDKAAAIMEKLKNLGRELGRALDIAVDLFSGNEAELLSGNKTALLSGNKPNILSGNKTKLLSDNTTPIFSGNKLEMFSNIKIEIHIENSGNTMAGPGTQPPHPSQAAIERLQKAMEGQPLQTPSFGTGPAAKPK